MKKLHTAKKGQGIVEYAILLTAIALVSLAAITLLGKKTGDLLGLFAVVLPGTHDDENSSIFTGELIEFVRSTAANDPHRLDFAAITANVGNNRTDLNFFNGQEGANIDLMILDRN